MTYFITGNQSEGLHLADVNNDGVLDIGYGSSAGTSILLGNSDGTFRSATLFATGGGNIDSVALIDVNRDGKLDMVSGDSWGYITVGIGNGNGSFAALVSYDAGSTVRDMDTGDVNNDGIIDLITVDQPSKKYSVFFGNADGTFKSGVSYDTPGTPYRVLARDFDQDGILDLAILEGPVSEVVGFYRGNGDGTFKGRVSFATTGNLRFIGAADVDGDGGLDLVGSNFAGSGVNILLANTQDVSTLTRFDLTTRQSALDSMELIDAAMVRVNNELGIIGASQSRLSTAVSTLQVARENFLAAASQITDVDVAEEAASLVRHHILQQAGAAILAQANRSPALALALLT